MIKLVDGKIPAQDIPYWMAIDIQQALKELGGRRLPEGLESIEKIVWHRRMRFDKPARLYDDLQAQIIKQNPPPEGWEDKDLPIVVQEAREFAFRELRDRTVRIREIAEHLLIKKSDLPKKLKSGESDDANQVSLATITRNLHFLYQPNLEMDAEEPAEEPIASTGGA